MRCAVLIHFFKLDPTQLIYNSVFLSFIFIFLLFQLSFQHFSESTIGDGKIAFYHLA